MSFYFSYFEEKVTDVFKNVALTESFKQFWGDQIWKLNLLRAQKTALDKFSCIF